jgi:hypothetical protein
MPATRRGTASAIFGKATADPFVRPVLGFGNTMTRRLRRGDEQGRSRSGSLYTNSPRETFVDIAAHSRISCVRALSRPLPPPVDNAARPHVDLDAGDAL